MIFNRALLFYIVGLFAVVMAAIVPVLSWLSPLLYTVIFPIVAITIWKSEEGSLRDLGFEFGRGWSSRLAIGFLLGLGIPLFFLAIQLLAGWISLAERVEPVKDTVSSLLLILVKMILIVAIEEFVFRGFFLQALSRRLGLGLAMILSSLLWGAGHLTSMMNAGLPPPLILIGMTTFLLWGITLALCFLRTGRSLWLPYGLHLGINISFSLIGWPFIVQPHAPQWWIGNPAWSPESGLIGVVVWLIFAGVLYWLTYPKGMSRSIDRKAS